MKFEHVRAEITVGKDFYCTVDVDHKTVFSGHFTDIDLAINTTIYVMRYVTGVGCKHER